MSSGYKTVDYEGWLDERATPCAGTPEDAFRVARESIQSMETQYRQWVRNVLMELAERIVEYSGSEKREHVLRYIREIAHELRGTTGTFGRRQTSDVARGLYELAHDGPGESRPLFVEALWVHYHTLVKLVDQDDDSQNPQLKQVLAGLDKVKRATAADRASVQ